MKTSLFKDIQQMVFSMLLLAMIFAGSSIAAQSPPHKKVQKTQVQLSIDSLLNKAWATGRSNPSGSLANLKTIEALNEKNNPAYKQDVVMYYYGVFYKNMNRFEESEKHFIEYEAYQESKGNKQQIANVNMAKANLYSDKGDYVKGMKAITKSQKMYDELNDTLGVVRTSSKLGFFLLETGSIDESIEYFRKSLRLAKLINNAGEENIGYQNLGVAFEKSKQYDSAKLAYKNGYDLGEAMADNYNKIINRYNMGNILQLMKQYKESEPYVKASLQLADSIQIPMLSAASRQLLANLNMEQGQTDEGLEILKSMAKGDPYKLGLKDKAELYGLLVKGYKKKGDLPNAFANMEIMKVLEDSLLNTETRRKINEIEIQYQTEKRKQQIALLSAENNLSTLELKRQAELSEALKIENQLKADKLSQQFQLNTALQQAKNLADSNLQQQELINLAVMRENLLKQTELEQQQQIAGLLQSENILKERNLQASRRSQKQLGSGLLIVGLLGSLIFWLYQQQKTKNSIIAKQSEDLQILNREIHHRVKNNLQVVSSMLNLQAETIPDADTAAMFTEGSKRVQSMAFIHQNLYQGDSANSVNMTEYIQMLVEHLFDSYNITPDKVKLYTDIEPMKLHTDTVIPIGMILNELISNALKYAFKGMEKGELHISLKKEDALLKMKVKDNGIGMEQMREIEQLNSFGFKIIKAFTRKLKAQLVINNTQGTEINLIMSKFKLA
jgi:two-component sensor histidine kinase